MGESSQWGWTTVTALKVGSCTRKKYFELAATGFPFSKENKMFKEHVNPIPIKKIYFR